MARRMGRTLFRADFVLTKPIALSASLSLKPREVAVLFGPSGSGKTTALRCLAGLIKPKSGSIEAFSTIWQDESGFFLPARHRQVSMVFQDYALFPHLKAWQNIALACSENEKVARDWLTRFSMSDLAEQYPKELSGGQKQRVALMRALARSPKLLLLDEPFSAVDSMTRKVLRQELIKLRDSLDCAVVLVTHDWEEARLLADKVYILSDGKILQTGTIQELENNPQSDQVSQIIGI